VARPIEPDPRSHLVAFRLTRGEHSVVDKAAQAAGLTPPLWAREQAVLAAGAKPARRRKAQGAELSPEAYHTLRALGVELVRQGRNLAQMQHRLNAIGQFPPNEFLAHAAEVDRLLAEIRRQLHGGDQAP
jgi:hypothetical protein